ncbi:MAG TPA: folylpolyglutamate synthase/dihydrofolate synthase family protein [Actinomycetota bacterium]|nr:folylpolyglutamate synthase/dihydrofolate synthase family protein [Actinomycetota bacterium]
MSYAQAQAHLSALGIDAMKGLKPSLHRIEAMCDALDNPQRQIPAIHVTGTNGKTSTARIASSLLAATGLSVGTFTSPHLQSVRERIALNGEPIGEDEFGDVFAHLAPYLETVEARLGEQLSFFEVMTALFFLWAVEAPVDAVVVEVGLGGRWDATNVVDAAVAVLTNVGLDHTALLGDDRRTIAREKAGIIKHDSVVVTGERDPSILAVIAEEADGMLASVSAAGKGFEVRENLVALGGRYLSIESSKRVYDKLFLPLHGAHQGVNAATALEAVTRFLPGQVLGDEVVAQGFAEAVVPGRMETIAGVLLDVAHNPDGMSAFVSSVAETFDFGDGVFVLGILADKDYRGMLAEAARIGRRMVFTRASNVRSVDPDELLDAARELGIDDCTTAPTAGDAIEAAREMAGDGLVCVTGSHYVVGEARDWLLNQ